MGFLLELKDFSDLECCFSPLNTSSSFVLSTVLMVWFIGV